MSLVCNICGRKAKYKVIIFTKRFNNKLFYCREHKPLHTIIGVMDSKRSDFIRILTEKELKK